MLVALLALASAALSGTGVFLTKGLADRIPIWQSVGPLFVLNAGLALPLLLWSGPWQMLRPAVLGVHLASAAVLVIATASMFALLLRCGPSPVGLAQALSPATTLLIAPLVLADGTSVGKWLAVAAVVAGGLLAMRGAVTGLASGPALLLTLVIAASNGMLAVLTALLTRWGVGLAEIYIVRAVIAGAFFLAVAPPRDLRPRALPLLTMRAGFITAGFVLAILAMQRGDVVIVQSALATTPLFIIGLESLMEQSAPRLAVLVGAGVICAGAGVLARFG